MPTPEFITSLRRTVGHDLLWLSGAIGVVLRGPEERRDLLMVRRSDTGVWTPICGIVEPGECPDRTVVREAREEAGVDIEVERFLGLNAGPAMTYPNGDRCQFLDHAFVCRWVGGEPEVGDDESSAVGWFPVDALPPMGDQHARTVAAALAPAGEPFMTERGVPTTGR